MVLEGPGKRARRCQRDLTAHADFCFTTGRQRLGQDVYLAAPVSMLLTAPTVKEKVDFFALLQGKLSGGDASVWSDAVHASEADGRTTQR